MVDQRVSSLSPLSDGLPQRKHSDLDPLHFNTSDANAERKKAREEAAIAKAAGFEWVNVSMLQMENEHCYR